MLVATSSENFSGAAKCLLDLAIGLKKKGNSVVVLLPRKGAIESELNNASINYIVVHEYESWLSWGKYHRIKKILNNILGVPRIISIIKKHNIQLIHINAVTGGYSAAKAAYKCNIPVIWHLRESLEKDLGITFFNSNTSIGLIQKSTAIIAISNFIANTWKKRLNKRIKVIYDGISINNYYVKDHHYNSDPNILMYGRIVPQKGQLELVKAIKLMTSAVRPHVELAGKVEDKEYFKNINQYINNNSLSTIKYVGSLKNIKEKLQNIDIVIVCSKAEGFGRVTIESMLAGCCVIAADTGASPEIITENVNGFLYKKGDYKELSAKIIKLIKDREYMVIAKNAQRIAKEKYSLTNGLNMITSLYKDVLTKYEEI